MTGGVVSWFDSGKGFGFITPDSGGPDVFVEYTEVVGGGFRTLRDGQRVEFGIRETRRGPEAHHVRVV
ncbi:cold-shock protein [Nocardia mangyaensis]|uniref:Cold-shock protein n=1 Tax=Nocardia mangyaensis TaxID=2213200 RepID=A0A1J0VVR5_9NOCA|nr:cold-shock protein [Nocardia mangyaensis]APE36147.1 cold-shock protein [Nocardia mangyaensis]MDO3645970.1 cold-shock protein [Nocardia mangyaensis]